MSASPQINPNLSRIYTAYRPYTSDLDIFAAYSENDFKVYHVLFSDKNDRSAFVETIQAIEGAEGETRFFDKKIQTRQDKKNPITMHGIELSNEQYKAVMGFADKHNLFPDAGVYLKNSVPLTFHDLKVRRLDINGGDELAQKLVKSIQALREGITTIKPEIAFGWPFPHKMLKDDVIGIKPELYPGGEVALYLNEELFRKLIETLKEAPKPNTTQLLAPNEVSKNIGNTIA